jgi:hypothetical protein
LLRVPALKVARVASGRDQADTRVHLSDGDAIRQGRGRGKRRRRIADLVVAPKFIPQFPGKAPAMIAPVRVHEDDPLRCFERCSGTQVQCNLGLRLKEFAKAQELDRAERVVLGYTPGQVQFAHAHVRRSHAVVPVIR